MVLTKKEQAQEIRAQKARTQYRRTEEASPMFNFSLGALVASKSIVYDIGERNPITQKYLPFSNIRIMNNSIENVTIFINQRNEGLTIPAGTIITLDKGSIPSINSIKFTNISATDTSADEIKFTVWRESLVIDEGYRRLHKALFSSLYGFK